MFRYVTFVSAVKTPVSVMREKTYKYSLVIKTGPFCVTSAQQGPHQTVYWLKKMVMLSEAYNLPSALVRRDSTLAEPWKYRLAVLSTWIWTQSQLLQYQHKWYRRRYSVFWISTNQNMVDLRLRYKVGHVVSKRKCLAPPPQDVKQRNQMGKLVGIEQFDCSDL